MMGPELLGRLFDDHAAALVLYARQWCATPEDVVQYIVSNAVLPKLQELRAPLDATLVEALSARDIAATPGERSRLEAPPHGRARARVPGDQAAPGKGEPEPAPSAEISRPLGKGEGERPCRIISALTASKSQRKQSGQKAGASVSAEEPYAAENARIQIPPSTTSS